MPTGDPPYSVPVVMTERDRFVSPIQQHRELSDRDVDRIARRVVELMREAKP